MINSSQVAAAERYAGYL